MKRLTVPLLLVVVVALLAINLYQWRTAAFTPERAVADRFTQIWGASQETWRKNTFMGIPAMQNPLDVWVTLEIIWDVKPDVILETGTFKGGSALLWAMFLEHVNPEGRVVTIDLRSLAPEARQRPLAIDKVDFLIGSSTAPGIVEDVKRRVEGKRVLAILDSLHTRDHVYDELKAYASIIPVGSYIIVQDGAVCGHPQKARPCPGPYEAVEDFLAENDDFVAVREHERLLMTANPMGFLERVK